MNNDIGSMRFEDHVEAALAAAYAAAYGKAPDPSRLAAIAMRAGTRGAVATLDEAGEAIGVTRERLRQIESALKPQLAGVEIPSLTELLRTLADWSPVLEPIGERLAQSGKSRPTLTGGGLLNLLTWFGTSTRDLIGTDLVRVDGWLVEESEVPVMKSVSMAAKHTSTYGMTTVEEIRQALATPQNPLDSQDIRRILNAQDNIGWADEWLWVDKETDSPHANRLINTARSILSVNSPQTITSVHEGCRRVWKFRKLDILPPVTAMKAFFEASRHFVVNGDLVEPVTPLDYHVVLGDASAAMIDVLKSQPHQVMDRRTLAEACDEAGIKASTSSIWTTFAEWMENFGPSVWGLRGSNPNPAVVEAVRAAARQRAKAEPKRKKWTWNAAGYAVQTFDIRTAFASSGVMSFMGDIHTMLAGQQVSVRHCGQELAIVKVGADHSFCWGWTPVLSKLDARAGQVMQVTVNIAARTAEVTVGGESLWNS